MSLELAAVAVLGTALAVLAAATRQPPRHGLLDRDGYLSRWSALHGGYDARTALPVVRVWLGLVHACARPLARAGTHPDVLTLASLWAALAVLAAAEAGGRWAFAGAAVLVLSGLLDALDGAVAVLTGRTTRWGYVLDSTVDRLSDVALLMAAVALGAPLTLGVAVVVGAFLLEYVRARAGNAGGDVVTVTVAERPVRVGLVVIGLLAAGASPGHAAALVTAALAVLAVLTAGGLVQLLVAVRRQLAESP